MNIVRFHIPLFIISLLVSSVLYGQNKDITEKYNDSLYLAPPKHHTIIKTNPLTPLWGTIPLTAEYRGVVEFITGYNQTTQVAVSFLGKGPIVGLVERSVQPNNNQQIKFVIYGGRLQLSHKFYLKEAYEKKARAPYGYYIAPHMSYASATITTKAANRHNIFIRATQFNVAVLGGYQMEIDDYSVDFFCGGGYKNNFWEENNQGSFTNLTPQLGSNFYTSNFKIYLGFNVGLGFSNP